MVHLQLHIEQYHWNKLYRRQTRFEAATDDDDAIFRIADFIIFTIWSAIFSLKVSKQTTNQIEPLQCQSYDDDHTMSMKARLGIPPDNFPWIS